MKTWAILNSENVVINCIVADSQEIAMQSANNGLETPLNTVVEYYLIEPGWSYIDNAWVKP